MRASRLALARFAREIGRWGKKKMSYKMLMWEVVTGVWCEFVGIVAGGDVW